MTTKAGYIGSDAQKWRFHDPKTNEAYFVLVNEKTGEMELYNEEFLADKRVGTLSPDGTIEYNQNWWGGANANDKAFAEKAFADGTITRQANLLLQKEGDLSPSKAKNLLNGNNALKMTSKELKSGLQALGVDGVDPKTGQKTNAAGTKVKFGVYQYPVDMDKNQDIIQFNMMKFRPTGFNKKGFGFNKRAGGDIIGTVVLPIPTGIADQDNVSWGDDSMNAVQAAIAKAALDGITAGNPVEGVIKSFEETANKLAGNSAEAKAGLAAALAGRAAGNQNLLARTTGAVLNPNMELLFSGPTLRPFTFNFMLSPRNSKEGKEIMHIIRFFKQGMAPIRSKSNLFLKSPHTFQLKYKYRGESGKDHPYLNSFKECALQGFGVQYTPSGNYSTFSDGVMTQYNITMSFKELEPVFNDDYGTGDPANLTFAQ